MEITYLGTGGAEGIPSLFCECDVCRKARKMRGRNIKSRSCTRINNVMIDFSPDIFYQSLNSCFSLSEIHSIVFTHSHSDHLNTLEIRLRLREKASVLPADTLPITFYGNEAVERMIEQEINKDKCTIKDRMSYHLVHKYDTFFIDGLKFTALPANHKLDENSFIYVIESLNSTILYGNDTGELFPETLDYIKKKEFHFDLVSMDTGRGMLSGDTHMGLEDNIRFKNWLESNSLVGQHTKYYLNHFSHMCGIIPDEYEKIVRKHGFELTYDGLSMKI